MGWWQCTSREKRTDDIHQGPVLTARPGRLPGPLDLQRVPCVHREARRARCPAGAVPSLRCAVQPGARSAKRRRVLDETHLPDLRREPDARDESTELTSLTLEELDALDTGPEYYAAHARPRTAAAPRPRVWMTLSHATRIVGSLGMPSKLPGHSWGISAKKCIRGSKLLGDPNTPCHSCYARKNFYATWIPVQIAHRRRLAGLNHSAWVDAITCLIENKTNPEDPHFRWLDSGDLQSPEHFAKIVEVCHKTPSIRHWLPTHEPAFVQSYIERADRFEVPCVPPNLCVRISADYLDQAPPPTPLPSSTVHRGHGNDCVVQVSDRRRDSIECKAYLVASHKGAAGVCGKCRACWNPRVKNISYPIH